MKKNHANMNLQVFKIIWTKWRKKLAVGLYWKLLGPGPGELSGKPGVLTHLHKPPVEILFINIKL